MAQAPPSKAPPDPAALVRVVADPLTLETRDDAPALVRALPAQSFVQVVRRLDAEGRLDLVLPHATPEQLTAVMDLDAWHKDRVDPVRARAWLDKISEHRRGGELARGRLIRTMYGMDPEMWSLALHRGMVVEEIDPEDEERRFRAIETLSSGIVYETPDRQFIVGVPADAEGERTIRILQRVYEDSLRDGARLVRSIEALLPSVCEEDLLRYRTGRLCDMGFVPWEDAMKLLQPLPAVQIWRAPARTFVHLLEEELDDAALASPPGTGRLRRIFDRLAPAEHGLRTREFLYLAHHLISAQRFEPGDTRLEMLAVDQTRATLELGFELALAAHPEGPPADPDGALVDRIAAIGLRPFFQVGYGTLDRLRKAAGVLHRSGRVSLTSPGSLLDRPHGPYLAAALAPLPMRPAGHARGLPRPIDSVAAVAEVTRHLAEAGLLARLTFDPEGFGISGHWIGRVDEPERLRLSDLVRTAVALRVRHGKDVPFRPLETEDLAHLHARFTAAGRRLPEAREHVAERLGRLGAGAEAADLAAPIVTRLEAELAGAERTPDGSFDLTRFAGVVTVQSVGLWLATTAGK